MLRLPFFCLLIILGYHLAAQQTLSGEVKDAANGKMLSNVYITTSGTGISTISDTSGKFSFKVNVPKSPVSNISSNFSFYNNVLTWNDEAPGEISVYSLTGQSVFHSKDFTNNHSIIPIFPPGHYFLVANADTGQARLLLYSDGTTLYQLKKPDTDYYPPATDSSIWLMKTGYYPREVKIHNADSFITTNLLKKSYPDLDYFGELINYDAFKMIESSPILSVFGNTKSIKVLYDFESDEIYYANTKKYNSHFSFAETILGYDKGSTNFFYSQYGTHSSRYLHLITINHFREIDKYVFEFSSVDLVDCDGVRNMYNKILESSYFGDKLYFFPNNLRWKECAELPLITSEELYEGQYFQALNTEEGYGYLRKVDIDDLQTSYLSRHDLVILNGIPNDLSIVSGIITTEFQTPLSHINILSHNRKTPNMALKDAWDNPTLDNLLGELVHLKVEADTFFIRPASYDEAEAFWLEKEPQEPVILEMDLETSGMIDLHDADYNSVVNIGGKAANFAELVNLGNIPVPETYFAIPFYYYHQHITNHGIDTLIETMLNDETIYSNLDYRREKLEDLRNAIIDAPLDPILEYSVMNELHFFSNFESFRFRSSTNAEDLEDFSGAGLYDSYSAKKNHSSKTIAQAIKKVWASLWNLRAFDERDYYKIDQNSIAMGILVHRSFPDEDANGVVITKNLYNNNHGYTINLQYKEYSIVYPEPGIMHDQIIAYTISLEQNSYTFEYLTQSNVPELNGQPVMSETELTELADYCTTIKEHYFNNIPHGGDEYNSFAVDIEFKVDSEVLPRKIYIKQVRIYSAN